MNYGRYIWSGEITGSKSASNSGLREYFLSVYSKMCTALGISGLVSLVIAYYPPLFKMIYFTPLRWVVAISPITLAFYLSCRITTINLSTARMCLWIYAGLVGASLSSIFYMYSGAIIARAFFLTSAVFFGMSLYGYTTKKDLSGIGAIAICGFIGVMIASLLNLIMRDPAVSWFLSIAIVACVTALTAYDVQRLKGLYYEIGSNSPDSSERVAILGALTLYLDFVNMFIALLDVMSRKRDRW